MKNLIFVGFKKPSFTFIFFGTVKSSGLFSFFTYEPTE